MKTPIGKIEEINKWHSKLFSTNFDFSEKLSEGERPSVDLKVVAAFICVIQTHHLMFGNMWLEQINLRSIPFGLQHKKILLCNKKMNYCAIK